MRTHEKIREDLGYLSDNLAQLNQKWNIEDSPIRSETTILGKIIVIIKRCIRKSIYWLIRPYWEQQISFNNSLTAAISDIYRIQCGLFELEQNSTCFSEDTLVHTPEPRIIQLVSSLNFGDAVGNEVIAFKKILQESGYVTEIYTNHVHKKIPAGTARFYRDMPPLRESDLVIYHFASECAISEDIKDFPCKVILRYHNVTPPEFFHGFDENAEKACRIGLEQVNSIRPYVDYCLPVSNFNMQDLQKMGYDCPMKVMPILIRFEDYEQEPDPEVIKKYSDGITNILFVGRMAPNKKIEDVISVFAYYKEHYDHSARLFLVGSFQESDKYYQLLQRHIRKLSVKDVIFPGHISFQEILAYYKIASVFMCMSEHEGFCVPLIEAMYFNVPIIAYAAGAVPETLDGAGIVVQDKKTEKTAEQLHSLISKYEYKEKIVLGQTRKKKNYTQNKTEKQLLFLIKSLI